MTNVFYVIATPIGNLEDFTFRAVRILKEVDIILCEDTRVTRVLLDRYEITTPTISYHANASDKKHEKILSLIEEGKTLALVSDSGSPCISDPGVLLVKKIKEEFDIQIIPIPGASAVITALSASGVHASSFIFLGFLPQKKGRETMFKKIADAKDTIVLYESPHRILKTLESLSQVLGVERKVVIARELTKIYEEFVSGSATEVLEHFKENPESVRGEFTVIISV